MKKNVLPLIVVVAAVMLVVSTPGCKKANLDLTWTSLEGSGFYHSQDDTSSIDVSGMVQLEIPHVATDPMWAEITGWRFLITEGSLVILEINSDNYLTALGDITFDMSGQESTSLWVSIKTATPKPLDIYDGANPDTVVLTLLILDSNGNTHTLEDTAAFNFTRD
jgi:hypothetical protein